MHAIFWNSRISFSHFYSVAFSVHVTFLSIRKLARFWYTRESWEFIAPFCQQSLTALRFYGMRASFLRSFVRNPLHENPLGPCHRFYAWVHREFYARRRSHEAELEEWMELAFSIFAQSAKP